MICDCYNLTIIDGASTNSHGGGGGGGGEQTKSFDGDERLRNK